MNIIFLYYTPEKSLLIVSTYIHNNSVYSDHIEIPPFGKCFPSCMTTTNFFLYSPLNGIEEIANVSENTTSYIFGSYAKRPLATYK